MQEAHEPPEATPDGISPSEKRGGENSASQLVQWTVSHILVECSTTVIILYIFIFLYLTFLSTTALAALSASKAFCSFRCSYS